MRVAIAVVYLAGCSQLLGITNPSVGVPGDGPGAHDGPGARDAPPGPDGPAACAALLAFGSPTNFSAAATLWFDVGDLNHDGRPDVVLPQGGDPPIQILHGNGTGLGNAQPVSLPMSCTSVQTALVVDLDKDGYNDLLVVGCGQLFYLHQNQATPGTFDAGIAVTGTKVSTAAAGGVAVGDLNHDGILDIATTDRSTLAIAYQMPVGTFVAGQTLTIHDSAPTVVISLAAGDFNDDGADDLVYLDNGNVELLPQTTPGQFGSPTAIGPVQAVAFGAGHFAGTARLDLAVLTMTPANDSLLLQKAGGGFSSSAVMFGGQGGKFGVFATDADGDGRVDIEEGGDVTVQCHAPAAPDTFQVQGAFGVGPIDRFVDLTGDGKPDLLFIDTTHMELVLQPAS